MRRKYKNEADIPEKLRTEYIQKDGFWVPKWDDEDDEDVDPDDDLTHAIKRERQLRKEAQREAKEAKRVAEEIAALGLSPEDLAAIKKNKGEETYTKAQFEQKVAEMRTESENRIAELQKQIDGNILEKAAREMIAASKVPVKQKAIPDVIARFNQEWRHIDGRAVMLDQDGDPKIGKDGRPIQPSTWLDNIRAEKDFWFDSPSGPKPPNSQSEGTITEPRRLAFNNENLNKYAKEIKAGTVVLEGPEIED